MYKNYTLYFKAESTLAAFGTHFGEHLQQGCILSFMKTTAGHPQRCLFLNEVSARGARDWYSLCCHTGGWSPTFGSWLRLEGGPAGAVGDGSKRWADEVGLWCFGLVASFLSWGVLTLIWTYPFSLTLKRPLMLFMRTQPCASACDALIVTSSSSSACLNSERVATTRSERDMNKF